MPVSLIPSFLSFCFINGITPGPANLCSLSTAMNEGKQAALALPHGATINMDAVSIVMSFMIVFFANATGTELSYGLLAAVLLSNTLLSIGAPGVPNSAIASFAALAAIAGLPTGIMGMYVSVNILVDAGATCCNVLGDIASAVAMKKTCRLPDRHA